MANVKFERGLEDDVTTEIPTDGHLYVGTDTGNMYLGKNDGTKLPIGQSDWNQTDATKSDFIKNKPDIPTKTSDLTNDSGFITASDIPTVTVPEYTVEKLSSAEQGYASSYVLKKDGTQVGATINIPLDMVVSNGEVKTVTTANVPYQGAQVGDKYIDLTIANATQNHIYIPVKDLVDVYTEGNGIDISSTNVVSVVVDANNSNGLSVSASGVALATATTSSSGAMSAADKTKLDNLNNNIYNAGENISIEDAIPYGYTLLEYVYNSSGTYQNTGILPTVDDVELEIVYRDYSSTNYQCLLGSMPTSNPTSHYGIGYFGSSKIGLGTNGTYIGSGVNKITNHIFHIKGKLKNGNGSIYVKDLTNGTEGIGSGTYTFSATQYNIEIFRRRHNSSYMTSNSRVYLVRIKIKGATVLNYLPVKRDSDDVCGFWDTVSKTFVTATAGQWNAGAVAEWDNNHVINAINIPTSTSDLTNDSGFITSSDLPEPYTAGNGIAINSNNEISAKVSEGNGLGFVANGDIALSLVQNSANGAMASDDFRKLYDNVEMVQLLGTEYPLNNWYIDSSNNNYVASTTYKSYLISVSSIGKVSIYDSATTTYYSFLKPYEEGGSSNVPGSTDYAYATGYTGRKTVARGTTEVVSVPSDATWLWVYSGKNKAYDPSSLKFTGIAIGGGETPYSLVGEHGVSVTTDQTSGVTNLGLSPEWVYYAFWYKYTALYDLRGVSLPIDTGVINMSNSGFEFPKAGWYFVSVQIIVDITRNNPSSMIHAELMWEVNKGTRHSITALSISVPNGGVVPLNMQGVFQLNEDPVSSFVISLKMEITAGSANIVIDAPTGGSWIEHSDQGSNIFIRRLNPYH